MPVASPEDICNVALLRAGLNVRIGGITEQSAEAQACNTEYDLRRVNLYTEFRWAFTIKRQVLVPLSGVAYAAGTNFGLTDYAQYGDYLYQSLQANNQNHQPDLAASAAWWKQITRDGWAKVCPSPPDMLEALQIWEKPTAFSGPTSLLGDPEVPQSQLVIRAPESSERGAFALENSDDGGDTRVILTDLDAPVLRFTKDVTNVATMHPKFIDTFAWHLAVPIAQWRGDMNKVKFCEAKAQETLGKAFIVNMRDQQEDPEPDSEFVVSRTGRP